MRTAIAIYFDLENIDPKLNLRKLLESITLGIEDSTPVFAIKLACGDTENISKFREQLKNLNFEIRETPHISERNLKNRADLILTVEAFESLYQKSPDIDLYVFITSDTDFTVIMDKLRKYGKNVWLVAKEADKEKEIFTSSSDKILVMETCFEGDKDSEFTQFEQELLDLQFSKKESETLKEVIESYEKDTWILSSSFGLKMRNSMKGFSYGGKKVKSQTKLFEKLERMNILETKKENAVDYFKVIK